MKEEEDKIEIEAIKDEAVRQGLNMVRRKHPLYDTAIWKTLPYLKPIKDYFPKWVPRSQDEQLIKQEGRENAGHVEKLDEDEK